MTEDGQITLDELFLHWFRLERLVTADRKRDTFDLSVRLTWGFKTRAL